MDGRDIDATKPGPQALFLAFLSVGLSGFGGVLPFARRMLVDQKAWLDEAEFVETLALCQSLPGPNILNLSVVVGSRFAGVRGAFAALTGLTLAPVAIIIGLGLLMNALARRAAWPARSWDWAPPPPAWSSPWRSR